MEEGKNSKKHEPLEKSSKWVPNKKKSMRKSHKQFQKEQAKTSKGCGHQWIYPFLPFCAISCILCKEKVAPKHF